MQISLGTTNNQATFLHFRERAKYLAFLGLPVMGEGEKGGSSPGSQPLPRQSQWALPLL